MNKSIMTTSSNNSAYLELIIGPMYSGKSSRLVEIYKQCKFCNISVAVINHSIDKMVEIFSSIYESIDKSFFTLLDVVKQDDKYKKIDLYDSSIISGFIDLSTYDDDYTYDYGKKEVSTTNDKSSFCTATVESVRKTIERFCKKK